jgi:hypothetical protein
MHLVDAKHFLRRVIYFFSSKDQIPYLVILFFLIYLELLLQTLFTFYSIFLIYFYSLISPSLGQIKTCLTI